MFLEFLQVPGPKGLRAVFWLDLYIPDAGHYLCSGSCGTSDIRVDRVHPRRLSEPLPTLLTGDWINGHGAFYRDSAGDLFLHWAAVNS